MDPHIRSKPVTLCGREHPAIKQKSHPPMLVRAFEGLFSDLVQESSLTKIPQVDVKLELVDQSTPEEV